MNALPGLCLAPALLLLPVSEEEPAKKKQFTLEQTVRGRDAVSLAPEVERWAWAHDGVHLVRGEGDEKRWVAVDTGEERAPEPAPEQDDDAGDDGRAARRAALERLDGVDEKLARRIASRREGESADGGATLFEHDGALWFTAGDQARRLTPDGAPPAELAQLASDGHTASFVRGNDLYLCATDSGRERRITADGDDEHFNGKLDWVYQEEVYGRGDFQASWWSPASTHLAFLAFDESGVHDFTLVDHVEEGHFRVRPEVTDYPKAGDPNPTVRLGVASVTEGPVRWVDLSSYAEVEPLVVRVSWSPDGAQLLFVVQDRVQTFADLVACDVETGASRLLIHETSGSWVPRPAAPRWLEDGTFLWESIRTGNRHLYRYGTGGELVGAVTAGDWSLRRVLAIDEERGLLWFTANEGGAVNENAYRIGLDGRGFTRLTRGPGYHRVTFDDAREHFLDRVSSLASPGETRLCSADGEVLRVLAEATLPAAEEYALSAWELVEIPARDGFPLDAAIMKPVDFDPTRAYPVWLPTYSGPNAPTVRNRWSSGSWYHFLAQQGFVVLQVNVRTASGKDHGTIGLCHRRLGVQELADLEDAVDWLTANPWADGSRVGITGGSYGGYMAAYAVTHSDRFALAIAASGVYDWGMYDTIYTERYMGTPQDNAEGYAASSVIEAAAGLTGHLLLIHGDLDDNVHMQNTMQLAWALQKAGKPFEMMIYPQARHGIRDADQRRHSRELEWKTIREQLGAPLTE